MFNKWSPLKPMIQNIYKPVEYHLESYQRLLVDIDKIKLSALSDDRLKAMSEMLRKRAQEGVSLDQLLVEAFALVREAAHRVTGMRPFNIQMIAGIAMHQGKIVEMRTGEGKTLAAVMPAYLNALTGKGVHVLTFNDYLAKRDAEWMGSVYSFLGITTGYIQEGMCTDKRRSAYSSHITYGTAKEFGFDYLRDFLCTEKERLLHRSFQYAIVDEADSILIDEARVPLVIAGNIDRNIGAFEALSDTIKKLSPYEDYEIDQYGRNVYLTERGLARVEDILECGNLYDPENLERLTEFNCALHAELLLKRDKDYIVRQGKIEIIDEFTGRIAEKCHWPDKLQGAVEAKEGLDTDSKGVIMGSIALQHFLDLYPKLSGMTGTAQTVADELREFYGMDVVVIPTNKPCVRKDHPDLIFTHREAKEKALLFEIKRVHEKGQPILIGTTSIEESEELADKLKTVGISCQILNAKNDEMEAKIIAKAGKTGAVTVSTNMAGRGIDIKLGGEKEQYDRVIALGGLYVIGTSRQESRRIDNQLRGRAGRQGDPGESRFYISLEDEWMKKYEIKRLIPEKFNSLRQEDPIMDDRVHIRVAKGQRVVEGYYSDMRRHLWRYSFIMEQQRQIIHERRQDILMDGCPLVLISSKIPQYFSSQRSKVGEAVLAQIEKRITLYYINKCWADYLDYMAYIRESIHLVVMGNKNPLDEFHRLAIEAFDEMLEQIDREILEKFQTIEIKESGIDLEQEGLTGPSSTWTYLISDSSDQFSSLPRLVKAATATMGRTFNKLNSTYRDIF